MIAALLASLLIAGVPTQHLGALQVNDNASQLIQWGASTGGANCATDPAGNVGLYRDNVYLHTSGEPNNCGKIQSPRQYGYGTYQTYIRVQGAYGKIAQWPAFYGNGPDWPNGGEIDAFEGLHGTDYAGFDPGLPAGHLDGPPITSVPRWHTVDVVWGPGTLRIYTDGILSRNWHSPYLVIKTGSTGPMWWTFDNAAWHGSSCPCGLKSPPSTMLVRYFRYWSWKP